MRFLLLIPFLFSCFPEEPIEITDQVPPHEYEKPATDLIIIELSERLDFPLWDYETPETYWSDLSCLEVYNDDRCFCGLFVRSRTGKFDPYIWVRYSENVSDGFLAHELLHWSLWVSEGDMDADHEHDMWMEIPDINDVLRRYKL